MIWIKFILFSLLWPIVVPQNVCINATTYPQLCTASCVSSCSIASFATTTSNIYVPLYLLQNNTLSRVTDLTIGVNISHSFIGDLNVRVLLNSITVDLILREGGSADDMFVYFDDSGEAYNGQNLTGGFFIQPVDPLSTLNNQLIYNEAIELSVYDGGSGDTGTLNEWCIYELCYFAPTISPTTNPTQNPTATTLNPSNAPSSSTIVPTTAPSTMPTIHPSSNPSYLPTTNPSLLPTTLPTHNPSIVPTETPTTFGMDNNFVLSFTIESSQNTSSIIDSRLDILNAIENAFTDSSPWTVYIDFRISITSIDGVNINDSSTNDGIRRRLTSSTIESIVYCANLNIYTNMKIYAASNVFLFDLQVRLTNIFSDITRVMVSEPVVTTTPSIAPSPSPTTTTTGAPKKNGGDEFFNSTVILIIAVVAFCIITAIIFAYCYGRMKGEEKNLRQGVIEEINSSLNKQPGADDVELEMVPDIPNNFSEGENQDIANKNTTYVTPGQESDENEELENPQDTDRDMYGSYKTPGQQQNNGSNLGLPSPNLEDDNRPRMGSNLPDLPDELQMEQNLSMEGGNKQSNIVTEESSSDDHRDMYENDKTPNQNDNDYTPGDDETPLGDDDTPIGPSIMKPPDIGQPIDDTNNGNDQNQDETPDENENESPNKNENDNQNQTTLTSSDQNQQEYEQFNSSIPSRPMGYSQIHNQGYYQTDDMKETEEPNTQIKGEM